MTSFQSFGWDTFVNYNFAGVPHINPESNIKMCSSLLLNCLYEAHMKQLVNKSTLEGMSTILQYLPQCMTIMLLDTVFPKLLVCGNSAVSVEAV